MAIQIKVLKVDFEAACSNGYVYGKLIRRIPIPVYVELGKQEKRKPRFKDNPSTRYKFFSGSTVYFAKTEKEIDNAIDLDNLDSLPCEDNVFVDLFC